MSELEALKNEVKGLREEIARLAALIEHAPPAPGPYMPMVPMPPMAPMIPHFPYVAPMMPLTYPSRLTPCDPPLIPPLADFPIFQPNSSAAPGGA